MFAHKAPVTSVRVALLQEGPCNLSGSFPTGSRLDPDGKKSPQEPPQPRNDR